MNEPTITKREAAAETITRREAAQLLNLHPDSVTRALSEGLGQAVLKWGGRSKPMAFSKALVRSFGLARSCRGDGDRPCPTCRAVLDDCKAVAEHLLDVRHGVLERGDCNPDDCGYPKNIGVACRF